MEENLRFPLFVDLHGKRAVVVGGGKIALRRVKGLRDFGADVTVIAPQLAQPMEGITHLCRSYEPGDLTGAFLAVAATNDRDINRAVGEEARAQSIPVSVADRAEECTFFFPALCTGKGMIAGVVSDGTDHHKTAAAAKAIRAVLEELE